MAVSCILSIEYFSKNHWSVQIDKEYMTCWITDELLSKDYMWCEPKMAPLHEQRHFTIILCLIYTYIHLKFSLFLFWFKCTQFKNINFIKLTFSRKFFLQQLVLKRLVFKRSFPLKKWTIAWTNKT